MLHEHSPGWVGLGKDAVYVWREASCIHDTQAALFTQLFSLFWSPPVICEKLFMF